MRALISAILLLLSGASALAHDSRPAYLEFVETDGAVFELIWKRPLFGGHGRRGSEVYFKRGRKMMSTGTGTLH